MHIYKVYMYNCILYNNKAWSSAYIKNLYNLTSEHNKSRWSVYFKNETTTNIEKNHFWIIWADDLAHILLNSTSRGRAETRVHLQRSRLLVYVAMPKFKTWSLKNYPNWKYVVVVSRMFYYTATSVGIRDNGLLGG